MENRKKSQIVQKGQTSLKVQSQPELRPELDSACPQTTTINCFLTMLIFFEFLFNFLVVIRAIFSYLKSEQLLVSGTSLQAYYPQGLIIPCLEVDILIDVPERTLKYLMELLFAHPLIENSQFVCAQTCFCYHCFDQSLQIAGYTIFTSTDNIQVALLMV